eukprot:17359_1
MECDPNEIDLDRIDAQDDLKQQNLNPSKEDIEMEDNAQNKSVKPKRQKKKKRKIRFRNYIPRCEKLKKKYCVPPASFIEIKDEFTELIEKAKILNHDIHDITPKKANWDLKRDCQAQLDQLKYLTQLAIRKIVEERQANMSDSDSDTDEDSDNDEDGDTDDTNDIVIK